MNIKTKPALTAANLFKNKPDLILRTMLKDIKRGWTGPEMAAELKISPVWAARVLATLEFEKFATRDGKRSRSRVFLTNFENLMTRWKLSYHIEYNKAFSYRILTQNPAFQVDLMAKKEGFRYAMTGQAAKDIKKGREPTPPVQVYIDPNDGPDDIFTLLNKLEDKYDLIPTHKNPNLIILEPHVGEGVFFDAVVVNGLTCVSDLQIELDTHNLSGGGL